MQRQLGIKHVVMLTGDNRGTAETIARETGVAAEELLPLLDEPDPGRWLTFQRLELCKPTSDIREKCLAIIREIAAGPGADALGAQYWLRDFKG